MERMRIQVIFNFGSVAYVGVKIVEGLSLEECIKRRSADIIGYIIDNEYHEIKED